MTSSPLHFRRFEFKYILDRVQVRRIQSYLQRYMIADPMVDESGVYKVVSLYFDSPRYFYYHQKMDGVKHRKKIRLRVYQSSSGAFSDDIFFEIKRKDDAVVVKDRIRISHDQYQQYRAGDVLLYPSEFWGDDEHVRDVMQEIGSARISKGISEKLLVRYDREPLLGKYNSNVRITFDYHIQARDGADLLYEGDEWIDVSGDKVIMEIKFNGSLPYYIAKIIHLFDLQRVSYSKYCNGIDFCGSLSYIPNTLHRALSLRI